MKIKKKSALWVVVSSVIAAVLVIMLLSMGHHPNSSQGSQNSNNVLSSSGSSQLFSSSPYSQVSYQIFPGPLSSVAKEMMAGIKMATSTNPDGSIKLSINPTSSNIKGLSYNLASGDKVYIIETSLGEDNPSSNYDGIYSDDGAIVVNSAGYIINGPTMV